MSTQLTTQFGCLLKDGGDLKGTAVSEDGGLFGIALMPDGTWSAYSTTDYMQATGLAALCGSPDERSIRGRVNGWV